MSISAQYRELTECLLNIIDSLPNGVRNEFILDLVDADSSSSADDSTSEYTSGSEYSDDESDSSDSNSIPQDSAKLNRAKFCFFKDTVTIKATKPKGVLTFEKITSGGLEFVHATKLSKKVYELIFVRTDEKKAIEHLRKIGWTNISSSVIWCTCVKCGPNDKNKAKSVNSCLLRRILVSNNKDKTLALVKSLKNLVVSQD
ncbi:hypothetical protein LPJ73_003058 [Coemansia sp. RSA 2703]|nr:hypothetical protein LPJ73_003058 [Coemansia sp. RSA 2703]KAJ2379451.1 hypothetical protein IW150_000170 [Coemansia sp. RSA 2607]